MPVNSGKGLFGRKTFRFLKSIAEHNDRAWFAAHKHEYEAQVQAPALDFIEAMRPLVAKISRHIVVDARKSGGSLMRIYRDTRFSPLKTPYKTNIGIQFRHERGRDVHAPGFYVHIEPRACFFGAGLWRPEASALRAIRREIHEQPLAWRKASRNKRFADRFELSGTRLQGPPRGYSADAEHIDDLRRKDFIGVTTLRDSDVASTDFTDQAADLMRRASPLMRFLCGALDLEF